MKLNIIKLFFTLAFLLTARSAFAQQTFGPEWGENATQEERLQNIRNYNFYSDAFKSKRYEEALSYLPQLLRDAPKGTQNLYVFAIEMFKSKVQQTKEKEGKDRLIDSLFTLFDLRMQHFGDHPKYGRDYISKQKAYLYIQLFPDDSKGIRKVFGEAIELNAANPDPVFINRYFKELTDGYLADAVETDEYLAAYDRLSAMMESITDPAADKDKETFDALFIQSKAGNCETIEKIFKARLAEDPNNTDYLAKAFNQLRRLNCLSPFFFDVADRYFRKEPSTNLAVAIARAYEKVGNNRQAQDYLRAAVNTETDPLSKANLYTELSGSELKSGNAQSAANYAKQAIQLNPENGYAYMFLGQAYATAASSTCKDTFDAQTVFWLAYDMAQRARKILAANTEVVRNIDELMAGYRRAFPPKDEIFFRVLDEGASYEVKCGWITGTTTVRQMPK